jgi:hypothetical protein
MHHLVKVAGPESSIYVMINNRSHPAPVPLASRRRHVTLINSITTNLGGIERIIGHGGMPVATSLNRSRISSFHAKAQWTNPPTVHDGRQERTISTHRGLDDLWDAW